jgi:acyl carrier protein
MATCTTGWDSGFDSTLRQFLPFLPAREVLPGNAALRDLGLDSVGVVELLAVLEKDYGVRFRDDILTMDTFATPDSIWAALTRTAS